MKKVALSALEKAINQYLALDPESKKRLSRLQGKFATITLLPFDLSFHCHFTKTKMKLSMQSHAPSAVTLRGTPLQLLGMLLNRENRQQFFANDLQMTGDAEFGQQIVELFDHIEIDWEDYLAKLIGDVAAYQTGRFLKHVWGVIQHVDDTLAQNVNEYIHEEIHVLPPAEALQDYFADIDALRMDVDRLAAKIDRLKTAHSAQCPKESL